MMPFELVREWYVIHRLTSATGRQTAASTPPQTLAVCLKQGREGFAKGLQHVLSLKRGYDGLLRQIRHYGDTDAQLSQREITKTK